MVFHYIYNGFVFCYGIAIRMASFFNPKAKKWVDGRKDWYHQLEQKLGKINRQHGLIWLHAASVGEFEQGKPILEKLKAQHPNLQIAVSFFSPSGYEAAVGKDLSDIRFYLPDDTVQNAQKLVDLLKPDLVIWVKYEFWWNHLLAISRFQAPLIMISAIFQERHPFFKWYGGGYRKMLNVFTHIFVQTHASSELLKTFFPSNKITVSGDTRFDRVKSIADNWQPVPLVEKWIDKAEWVIVAGSTWPDDEKLLRNLIRANQKIKWIIAPHRLGNKHLIETLNILPDALVFSKLKDNFTSNSASPNLLIVDGMGMLARIYKYARICYIGGGFTSTGIHNALEASIYGKPLIFGPEYERYAEAIGLIKAGAAVSIGNVLQLETEVMNLINNQELCSKRGEAALNFTLSNTGATQKVMEYIHRNRLLTNV